MKKNWLLGVTVLLVGILNANECSRPWDNCFSDCSFWKDGTFSIGGDWLYWKIEQQKMQVGAEVAVTQDGAGNPHINSSILKPHFKEQSGYRVFADYTTADDRWKIEAAFTHAPSQAGFNHNGNPANINFDFVSIFNTNFPILTAISGDTFNSVSSKWNVDVNYFDVDLSRKLSICEFLEIKPHIGIRGQWIKQKFRINGTDDIVFRSALKGKLQGIGLEGGLWGQWNVGCGFSVIGHVGGAIVYARSRNHGSLNEMGGNNTTLQYTENSYITLPAMDSFIGVAYTTNCRYGSIMVHAGWEHHLIANTNQFSISGGGDMTLQGLTLGGSLSF